MASLKVRVLGKGLIPRGGGIAPRKEPLKCDLNLIQLMLSTRGLEPLEFINPETNKAQPLTRENLKRTWDRYADYKGPEGEVPEDDEDDKGDGIVDPEYTCPKCQAHFKYEDKRTPAEGEETLCPACEAFKKVQQSSGTPATPPASPTASNPVSTRQGAVPYFMIKGENGTMVSTGVTVEQVMNGEKKAKADWLIHKGGNEYVPVDAKYVEVVEEPKCDICGEATLDLNDGKGPSCTNPECISNKPADVNSEDKKGETSSPPANQNLNKDLKPGDPGYQFQPRHKENKDVPGGKKDN